MNLRLPDGEMSQVLCRYPTILGPHVNLVALRIEFNRHLRGRCDLLRKNDRLLETKTTHVNSVSLQLSSRYFVAACLVQNHHAAVVPPKKLTDLVVST